MLKKIWSSSKYYLFLGIGLAFLWLVFRDVDIHSVWEEMKSAKFSWLFASCFFGILAMVSRAERWRIILEPLGQKPSLIDCFNGVSIGYLANTAVPRMGEIVRCTVASQTIKISVPELIGTVILERVIDVILLFSLIIAVVFSQMDRFGDFFVNEVLGKKLEESGVLNFLFHTLGWWLLLLIPFMVILAGLGLRAIFTRFPDKSPVKKVNQVMRGLSSGFITLFKLKRRGAFLFHTLFIWFNYYLMTWLCVFAYQPTAGFNPLDGLFLMVVGGLGMTAPAPGGIGPFHLFVSKALMLYGLTAVQGIAFATMVHTTQFFMMIGTGIFSLILLGILKRKRSYASKTFGSNSEKNS